MLRKAALFTVASVTALFALAPLAEAASLPDEFCTGDPCVITGTIPVDHLAVINFEGREVELQGKLVLDSRKMTLIAGKFSITGNGQIEGEGGGSAPGGEATIISDGDIILNGALASGAIDLTGFDGGLLQLTSLGGSITGTGRIDVKRGGTNGNASGGFVFLDAAGEVNLSGDVRAFGGGGDSAGGFIDIAAGGPVTLSGKLDVSGGEWDAGSIIIVADGPATLSLIDMFGKKLSGAGGTLDVSADGSITLLATVDGNGSSSTSEGGDGGTVDLGPNNFGIPRPDITISGQLALKGRGPEGCGGSALLTGNIIRINEPVKVFAGGGTGCGGLFDADAVTLIAVDEFIDAHAGNGGGSDVILFSQGNIEVNKLIDATVSGVEATGGTVDIDTLFELTVSSNILADGSNNGFGGVIDLSACTIMVNPSAAVRARQDSGVVTINSSGQMTLRGDFVAGPTGGMIDLNYRSAAMPPDTAGATFNPVHSETLEPLLPPCGIDTDGDGLGDDEDNCLLVINITQLDADADLYGNACDGDFDQTSTVGFNDFQILLGCFGLSTGPGVGPPDDLNCEESDMEGNGAVGFGDFVLFLFGFGGPPGPACCLGP